jgi:hypothetical protein
MEHTYTNGQDDQSIGRRQLDSTDTKVDLKPVNEVATQVELVIRHFIHSQVKVEQSTKRVTGFIAFLCKKE